MEPLHATRLLQELTPPRMQAAAESWYSLGFEEYNCKSVANTASRWQLQPVAYQFILSESLIAITSASGCDDDDGSFHNSQRPSSIESDAEKREASTHHIGFGQCFVQLGELPDATTSAK